MIAFILITVLFLCLGHKEKIFTLLCFITLSLSILLSVYFVNLASTSEIIIMLSGLCLYWFGLLGVRIIVKRSVSLHVLMHHDPHQLEVRLTNEISSRVHDITRYGLGSTQGTTIRLTHFGNIIAVATALIYICMRQIRR